MGGEGSAPPEGAERARPGGALLAAATFVLGATLPVLDGDPGASSGVRLGSVALLLASSAAHAARSWSGEGPLPAVVAAGAAGLAALQVRHLLG